jgi:peptidyl-prolyl cis-trans isomerase C
MLRRDPLIHFLVIGGLLFAVLSWFDRPPPAAPPREQILITADQVAELARTEALMRGHELTREELAPVVEKAVKDEVYYRHALDLGLDKDDDVVRQRLIEKVQYTSENVVDPEPPEADIEAYFEANREHFRIPERVSFDQLLFSPKVRGDAVSAAAEAALESLRGGADAAGFGDPTPLDAHFADADASRIRTLFNDTLTDAVFRAPVGVWFGPVESGFGWHLLRVTERTPARDPDFAEVEDTVKSAFARDRQEAANAAAFAEMRSHFDIAVQWDPDAAPEPWH